MKFKSLAHRFTFSAVALSLALGLMSNAAQAQFVPLLEVIDTPSEPLVSGQTVQALSERVEKLKRKKPANAFDTWLLERAIEVRTECEAHAAVDSEQSQDTLTALSVYAGVKSEKIAKQCELLAQEGFSPVCEVTAVPALLKNSKKAGLPYQVMTSLYRPLSEISRPARLERVAVLDCFLHRSKLIAQPASFKVNMVIEPFELKQFQFQSTLKTVLGSTATFTSPILPGNGEKGHLHDTRTILVLDPSESFAPVKN